MRKIFVLFACVFALFALVGHSQAISVADYYDFTIEFSPEIPGPNTTVSAQFITYSFDADRANITWTLNNKVALKGMGEKNFSFKTGDLGSVTNLTVSAVSSDGVQLSKNFSFRMAEVDILWEALNYTPLLYKGKALATSNSLIRITAIPYFPSASSKLVYDWEIDYEKQPEVSGTGKNSFTFLSAEIFNRHKVKLIVSNYDRSIMAEKSIWIEIQEPKVLFYKDNPLEGTQYNKALTKEINLEGEEIVLRAEPYFFSKNNLNQLTYEWLMNNQKIFPEEFPNVLSLRKGEGSGRTQIGVKVNISLNILQFGAKELMINY